MTVNVRRRRRKIDRDHSKKKSKKKQVMDTDYLYGDWLDPEGKAAKKKRKKFTGYSGDEII